MTKEKEWGFSTKAIHIGSSACPSTGAVITPIYATSTYKQSSPGVYQGYDYSRTSNPTRVAYEECIASLENGACAMAFSSGMAAASSILELLPTNSHIIAVDDLYGGSFRLFDKVKKISANLEVTYLDLSDPEIINKHLKANTKMIWVETPTNPMLKIFDLEKIASIAKANQLLSVADNTFASPYLQKPLSLGFDLVLHSATKYIAGHSDLINGVVVCKEAGEIAERLRFIQNAVGAVPGPFDCFLAHRGVKTLAVRMEKHCNSAQMLAEFLEKQPQINKVIYPGLASHPNFGTAKKQMRLPGGMISFELKANLEQTKLFLKSLKIFTLAESLGGVESLIEHPAIMTHASIPQEQRKKLGITDGFIRVSVGIEDAEDLIEDIKNALANLT